MLPNENTAAERVQEVVDPHAAPVADAAEAKALEQIKGMWSEAEAAPEEQSMTPEEPAKKPEPKQEPRLAELAKQDRRLRDREAQLAAREKELESYAGALQQLREDPYEALRQIGIDPADVVSRFVAEATGDQPAKDAEPPREIVELRGEIERLRAEQERTVLSGVRASELRSISELVAGSEDRFPLVRESLSDGAAELVLQVAAEDFAKNRRAYEAGAQRPSYEDYAGWVESYLEDNAKKTLARLSKLSKFKDHFAPARGEAARREKTTLTSKMSGEPARRRSSEYDEEEALEQAAQMMKQSGWVEDE